MYYIELNCPALLVVPKVEIHEKISVNLSKNPNIKSWKAREKLISCELTAEV